MTDYAADRHRAYLDRTLGPHAAFILHYHLVWSVKARKPLLTEDVVLALCDALQATAQAARIQILALHVESEHVHLLISLPPQVSIATAVGRLKGASAHSLRQMFPALRDAHEHSLWNDGYFVRSLGDVTTGQAKAYLDRQRQRHGGHEAG